MKFRILEVNKSEKYKYEIFYFDEYDNRGSKWQKVIWDKDSYCHFQDNNYTETIDDAMYKIALFKEEYEKEHGKLVKEIDM